MERNTVDVRTSEIQGVNKRRYQMYSTRDTCTTRSIDNPGISASIHPFGLMPIPSFDALNWQD